MKRDSIITTKVLYRLFPIHTGRKLANVNIRPIRLDHKLGEFAFTKKRGAVIHRSERNEKRDAKKKLIQRKKRKKK